MARTIKKKEFSLSDFKKENNLDKIQFKKQEWLEIDDAFSEATGVKGIPLGHLTLLMGHSDTSKTTAMIKAAASAQKMGKLPVFIITEMKWSWEHAEILGLEIEDSVNEETGEVSKDGFFIYVDGGQLKSIEDVAQFINSLLNKQEKGDLPYDLVFFWDSIGSVPCQMTIEKEKNNPEWNALAMSTQFSNGGINQRIVSSRKAESKHINTLVCISKVWVLKPINSVSQPKIMPKGGMSMYFDASLVFVFGNEANSGINRLKAVKDKKKITWATRVSIGVHKNHLNGISYSSKIVVTPTGYIEDSKSAEDKYKVENLSYFSKLLGEHISSVDEFTTEEEEDIPPLVKEPNE